MPQEIVINSKNYTNYSYIIPYISYCAKDYYELNWTLKRRKMQDYEFVFITEGTGRFIIEDRIYDVSPHDLLLIKPGIFHEARSISHPFSFLCIHFDLYVSPIPNDAKIINKRFYESIPSKPVDLVKAIFDFPEYKAINDSNYVNRLLRRIIDESTSQMTGFSYIIKSIFLDLLINLFRQMEHTQELKKYSPEVQSALNFIKRNIEERIYLKNIADHVHLQPAYLSSLFKKQTGQSITEFIRLFRVLLAKRLLLETDIKVNDIALKTGFCDIHHFSNVFKEVEGITPVQYRNQNK